jgi:hypothetical protein
MRQDFFEFFPQFKLFVAGNHKPAIRNIDEAMKRRLHLIPFTITVPPERRDKHLQQKLLAERDGILAWAVQGCLDWQRLGRLDPPQRVVEATEEYFEAEDALGRWLDECCVREANAKSLTAELFTDWKQWAEAAGEVRRVAAALFRSAHHARHREMAQQRGCAGISGDRSQEPARARLHPLRRQLTLMKNHPSDAADALSRNSPYVCACAPHGMFRQTVSAASDREQERTEHMNTTILALDLGTHTGWALHQLDGSIISGTEMLQAAALRRRRHALPAFQALAQRTAAASVTSTPCTSRKCAARRASMPHMPTAASWATSPRGASTTTSRTKGVPVGTIKKHATGKGNAGKDEMIAPPGHVVTIPVDDNEADALALLHWAIETQEV